MIIQLRGTSGSGKSTAMRSVMGLMGEWNSVRIDGRKQPLYYRNDPAEGWPDTVVLGHYETACGGCDTIGSAKAVYNLVSEILRTEVKEFGGRYVFPHILCEGLLLSEDVKWTTELAQDASNPLAVLFLTTPLDRCLSQIAQRRASVGNEKPLDPRNTTNRIGTIERARVKLEAAGVNVRRCSAAQAPGLVLSMLRLHAERGGVRGPGTELDHDADRG